MPSHLCLVLVCVSPQRRTRGSQCPGADRDDLRPPPEPFAPAFPAVDTPMLCRIRPTFGKLNRSVRAGDSPFNTRLDESAAKTAPLVYRGPPEHYDIAGSPASRSGARNSGSGLRTAQIMIGSSVFYWHHLSVSLGVYGVPARFTAIADFTTLPGGIFVPTSWLEAGPL